MDIPNPICFMNRPFRFKQFEIHQERCAMKIGTDGVLLGAWTSVQSNPFSILDIGAGTGIIALMLAQRSIAENIEAIEIDGNAYEQCVENFEASPWADRLFCYHAGLDELVDELDEEYDLIVSNPPFFEPPLPTASPPKGERSISESRKKARFYDTLSFNELLNAVSTLLSDEGHFSTILPYLEEERFIVFAKKVGLFPKRITRVKGNMNSEVKRSLLEFHRFETDLEIDELVIEKERHQYTEEYINLTKDFYLKM